MVDMIQCGQVRRCERGWGKLSHDGKERRKICWTFDISAVDVASLCIRIRLSSSFYHFQCPPDSRFSIIFGQRLAAVVHDEGDGGKRGRQ